MTKKLYFDKAHVALYMFVEHDVQYYDSYTQTTMELSKEHLELAICNIESEINQHGRILIESLDIFEPKEGDVILLVGSTVAGAPEGCSGVSRDYIKLDTTFERYLEWCGLEYEYHKIIMRNNKPFHIALEEE